MNAVVAATPISNTSLEHVTRIVESATKGMPSGNPHAMRFEAEAFAAREEWITNQIAAIMASNPGISENTALCIGCTSYGFYQMLGANIYSIGSKLDVIDICCDTDEQLDLFTTFCNRGGFSPFENLQNWDDARFQKWAVHQNGPGNTADYIQNMKEVLARAEQAA